MDSITAGFLMQVLDFTLFWNGMGSLLAMVLLVGIAAVLILLTPTEEDEADYARCRVRTPSPRPIGRIRY